ncbi:hypothetical protein CFC21_060972 [Triticum aestivum]|uniref:F-box domain-containing protein n=2 Tax=Triticum aestivum TaxID=4565 RepID=A0A9R1KGB5_WHEAT|nr:uncharacterized protein LOC123096323 isoform X1 [Triticum aestivum]XP_044373963.1 uncharacterized protein LOC123096323 isoform X1 [Triticum aestivum]XP_044373964.1 uncharacterized protein LOC123096323 isoform X1 [Triticum aestivum]KAF7052955.1 hypothetical protein CFC21_060972 [Triticum aestivum]
MSSTDSSSETSDSDSSDLRPATSVGARRLFDRMPPGIDCIGALPDGILHHILSFLPAQEAVRTCVLAQRWRHLWKCTTGLRIVGNKGPFWRWLNGLLFVSRCLRTLVLSGVGLQGTTLDFSSCPALEDLTIGFSVINVGKISSLSLKCLSIFRCRSYLDDRVRVSAPCVVSLKLLGFSGITPLLESMPLLETAFLTLGAHGHHTSQDICQKYSQSGVYCGAKHDACTNCHANNDGSRNCVVLGAISNAKHLELISSFGTVIFTRDLKWCPTFDKLKNLILNDYWCMGPSFDALSCILKHSPVLEKLSLHLFKGLRANVKMKGSYSSMERSSVISEHLKVVDVKCSVVDENVVEVLKFLCTLNIRFCFV